MNAVKIIKSAVKVIIIISMVKWLSEFIYPLKIIFYSNIFLLFIFQSMFMAIYNDSIEINKFPIIGSLFILSDYIVLNMFVNKNEIKK